MEFISSLSIESESRRYNNALLLSQVVSLCSIAQGNLVVYTVVMGAGS